jgi:hypothetical protein
MSLKGYIFCSLQKSKTDLQEIANMTCAFEKTSGVLHIMASVQKCALHCLQLF